MFDFIRGKNKKRAFGFFDCQTSTFTESKAYPVKIGGTQSCSVPLDFGGEILQIDAAPKGGFVAAPLSDSNKIFLNGAALTSPVEFSDVATLQIDSKLYYLFSDTSMFERARSIDVSKWLVFYSENGHIEDELPFGRIKSAVQNRGLSGVGLAICPKNFEYGFMYSTVFGGKDAETSQLTVPILPESSVAVTCPLCWLKFDIGDAMSIAVHESLRGDPVLGPDEMLRFLPTSFNDDGVPLDAAGMPSPDIACPHCRRKLPPNYLELDHKIFSIVGAPSAGKSYYLSVLIRELQNSLFKNFKITLKDLDPSGNMLLTQMKNRLFSAKNPEDAILAKTALEGAMYERYPRFGKIVALPKPMTYSLSRGGEVKNSIIFYDNAGEHFEPGLDIEESPGAMHVASSAAIFFLFDPPSNRNFKLALEGYPDPQLTIDGRIDQQDTILSEMEVRIKRILSIESSRRIETPLAVIIGKCDMWLQLLKKPLLDTIEGGKLNLSAVDANSQTLREFLLEIDPSIVSNAESISTNVKYFALSALGHSPMVIQEGANIGKIAPIPEKLNPINVEIPSIWALSQTSDLIPTMRE